MGWSLVDRLVPMPGTRGHWRLQPEGGLGDAPRSWNTCRDCSLERSRQERMEGSKGRMAGDHRVEGWSALLCTLVALIMAIRTGWVSRDAAGRVALQACL